VFRELSGEPRAVGVDLRLGVLGLGEHDRALNRLLVPLLAVSLLLALRCLELGRGVATVRLLLLLLWCRFEPREEGVDGL